MKCRMVAFLPGRCPRGQRGLKQCIQRLCEIYFMSLPAWAAWIETYSKNSTPESTGVAARVGSVD